MSKVSSPLRLKRKQSLFGALKTIAYFAGFPVFIIAMAIGSIEFLNFDPFESTWSWAILLALVIWAVCGVVQIVMACVVRGGSSQMIKTIVVGVVAIVCILGCALYIDFYGANVMEDVNAKYAAQEQDGNLVLKEITIPTYRFSDGETETITWQLTPKDSPTFETIDYLKGHYVTLTSDYDSELDKYKEDVEAFCRIYNVDEKGELKKKSSGSKETGDEGVTYVTNSDFSRSKVDAKTGLPVNDNGLVSESYIYSMDFALNVIINYNECVNALAALKLDMKDYVSKNDGESDEDYEARLAAMSNADKMEAVYAHELELVRNSAEYAGYKTGETYQAAYGENGTAYKYMLTVDRVEEMVPVLVKYLIFILTKNQLITPAKYDTVLNYYAHLTKVAGSVSLQEAVTKDGDLFENIKTWLSGLAELRSLLDGFGVNLDDVIALIDRDTVEGLVNDYFYYYSPSVRPDFDFFGTAKQGERYIGEITVGTGDAAKTFTVQQMRAFAFARYYAKINGAFIGSVLIPNNDAGIGALVNGNGNIGMVTLSSSGYDTSFAYDLTKAYQLKADNDYIPSLFPLLAARRYLYIFAGLILLSIILFYQFARREEEVEAEFLTYCQQKGGADNE